MKKSLIIAISALLGLGACDTMTTNLEGKWQLNQIESEGNVATVDTVWYNLCCGALAEKLEAKS